MDDLKLIGRSEEILKNFIEIVRTIRNDIKLEFGLEKMSQSFCRSGKAHKRQHIGNSGE
jgi:hypothetical protein